MRFPPAFIDQIRSANDIVEVIGTVVQLRRAGASFKGLSPFTKEKTPSFFVNPDKQVFYCFSSGQGGDVIGFLMKYEGLKFSEAVERLAERAKLPLPEPEEGRGRPSGPRENKSHLLGIQEKVREYYHSLLMRSPAAAAARDYLKGRKIGAETAKRFRLGYSPAGWDGLIRWAADQKIPLAALEKLGLVVKGKAGKFYDRFRERLMIPIGDEQGRTVGFTARLLKKDAKEAKYVNSPETELFSKGRLLFGLDRAKRRLIEQRTVVICEGQIDCISCHEAGFDNVVAPQGTAFTEYQARILKRYADEAILCFDPDKAGLSATYRNIFTLLREGLRVKAVKLPQGYDPDSFIKQKGAEAFGALLAGAQGVFQWLVPQYDWNDAADRMQGLRQVGELWRAIPDVGYRQLIEQELVSLVMISQFELKRALERGELPAARAPRPEDKSRRAEETVLSYCLLSESTASFVLSHLELEWLEPCEARDWVEDILAKLDSEGWEAAVRIDDEHPRAEQRHQLKARLLAKNPAGGREAAGHLRQCVTRLQLRHLAGQIRAKNEEFRRNQDPSIRREIQAQILDFEKREHELRKSLTSAPS